MDHLITLPSLGNSDPIRALIEEWDGAPIDYRSDRDLMTSVDPAISDLEWLEIQADTYRSMGQAGCDVARLVADAIQGVASRMEAMGCWDAAQLYARERDAELDRAASAAA